MPAEPADIVDVLESCIRTREAAGKYAARTVCTYSAYKIRFVDRVRELEGLPVNASVPATLLSRRLFERVQA